MLAQPGRRKIRKTKANGEKLQGPKFRDCPRETEQFSMSEYERFLGRLVEKEKCYVRLPKGCQKKNDNLFVISDFIAAMLAEDARGGGGGSLSV